MLDINYIREHVQEVKDAVKNRGIDVNIDLLIELDTKRRELIQKRDELRSQRNDVSAEIGKSSPEERPKLVEGAKVIKESLQKVEDEFSTVEEQYNSLLIQLPNLPRPDVKAGLGESANEVIKTFLEPKKFDFEPKDHVELGESLDIIDIERATKVSGARFAYLKNEGVLLELALLNFAIKKLTQKGFTPIFPPVLIKQDITEGLGYWQHGGNEDYYLVHGGDSKPEEGETSYYLVGTAEHSIVPMHKDEILNSTDLPKRYVGFSPAFRREAGSYGKDTKGILRVHQFDKVEMVSFTTPEKSDEEHEFLLGIEEELFQELKIPYQVIKMGTGDLGAPAARKYDIEAWIPTQEKYREVTSVSTVTDFQSRRLNIRYKNKDESGFAHILNGTAFAMGRTIIAILENYQQKDGSVVVPKVLREFIGTDIITKK